MIDLKIQYITDKGNILSTELYSSIEEFLLEINDMTKVQEQENVFKVSFINDELLSFNSFDTFVADLDANVFKKYKELFLGLPKEIRVHQDQLLTLSMNLNEISAYCLQNSKSFFELSSVIGIKDKVKNIYYNQSSPEFPSTTFLYLTQSFDQVYSICSETKVSKFFMNVKDVEYVDVLLLSEYGHPDYVYNLTHEPKFKEKYDNLFKV